MSATRQRGYRRLTSTAVALIGAGALMAGCTGNTPEESSGGGGGNNAASDNDESGDTVSIAFSAPAADLGWIAGINESARAEAEKYDDIDFQVAEGTNDVSTQISQVETFINEGVDAIVLLPFDGAALTPVALQAMEAGITVINVDREFDDPAASRATILGDNYGMGVSAGEEQRLARHELRDARLAVPELHAKLARVDGYDDGIAVVNVERDDAPGDIRVVPNGDSLVFDNELRAFPRKSLRR